MAKEIITEIAGRCCYEECEQPATQMACGRGDDGEYGHPIPAVYCNTHANMVADEQSPEYHDTCPNCGCSFGVN